MKYIYTLKYRILISIVGGLFLHEALILLFAEDPNGEVPNYSILLIIVIFALLSMFVYASRLYHYYKPREKDNDILDDI